jgi:hypothetical protein
MHNELLNDASCALPTKEGLVRLWRFEEFRRLGFATAVALRLGESQAELSVARRLVRLGCPLATASAILE